MADIVMYNDTYDIVFSEDEGFWYVQRFPDCACANEEFTSMGDAAAAIEAGGLTWAASN